MKRVHSLLRRTCASLVVISALNLGCATLSVRTDNERVHGCLDAFQEAFSSARTVHEKQDVLRALSQADLVCLVDRSKRARPLDGEFFISSVRRESKRVQRFFGVNGLVAFREFQTHFLVLRDAHGEEQVFGYTLSGLGRFTNSPGWFQLVTSPSGAASLDYTPDFERLLKPEEITGLWRGAQHIALTNNTHNVLFHDLQATLYFINDEVAVGVAERVMGERRVLTSLFALLRLP